MIYDLAVIGAGAAGSRAAFAGAARGLKTVLIEAAFAGGTCLNSGCIPTKFLLGGSAAIPMLAVQKKLQGLRGEITADLPAMQERKNRYIKGLRSVLEKDLSEAGIEYIHGRASFSGGHSLSIAPSGNGPSGLEFRKCIVASGSTPAAFPGLEPDGKNVLSSSGLLNLKEVPESIILIGGGVIGLELGEFYFRLGSKITMIEAMDRIALSEDAEFSAALHRRLIHAGWNIQVGRRVKSVGSVGEEALLLFEDDEELRASKAMIAVGRRPASRNLAPEQAGLKTARAGWIETDPCLLAAPDIYAAGDINGRMLLAHAAEHQAEYAVRHAFDREEAPYSDEAIPSCIYGHYEMMHAGPHTEKILQAHQRTGEKVEISRSQLAANPIAQGYGFPQGEVKITWVNGLVHSVAAWGHGVSQFATSAAVMVKQHWSSAEIIFAHPTLDEALKNALLAEKRPVDV
jgi:dihydrolipoamide dehydrogenase